MKKFLLAALLSTGAVALTAGQAAAGLFGHCCCKCCVFCVKPYNAFSPVCFGNLTFDGCGPGYQGPHAGYPAHAERGPNGVRPPLAAPPGPHVVPPPGPPLPPHGGPRVAPPAPAGKPNGHPGGGSGGSPGGGGGSPGGSGGQQFTPPAPTPVPNSAGAQFHPPVQHWGPAQTVTLPHGYAPAMPMNAVPTNAMPVNTQPVNVPNYGPAR